MSTTKRLAPRTPEGRPVKRRATSSPEEGELDDANSIGQPGPSETLSVDANSKFKIPFPFKNKNSLLSRIGEPPRVFNGRHDRDRERSRGWDWEHDERERNRQLPPVVYERSEEDERRFRQEDAVHGRDRRPRGGGGTSRQNSLGDHYEPSISVSGRDSYYRSRDHDRGRERNYDRRDRDRESMYSPSRREAPLNVPASLRSSTRSDSPLSVSRGRSPSSRSLSPQNRRDEERDKPRHRLPTPRSTSLVRSPTYDDRDHDRTGYRGDRYEPYRRDSYRDREHDPRGQYHREELDDYDRHYRPSDSYDWDCERGRPRYLRSPVFQSTTPPRPRPTVDLTWTPEGLPQPPLSRLPHALTDVPAETEPEPAPEALRAHEAVSIALRRPGAPLNAHSPPSMGGSTRKATPAPPPLLYPQQPVPSETPGCGVVKAKRVPVKRTREEEKAVYRRVFIGCGQRDDYDIMTKLGEGTFGEVHKALHKQTRLVVALKRILMHNEKEGMPVTALREIKILKALKHPCIVDLLDMFVIPSKAKDSPMSVYMVFPYMDHDLAGLLENERVKLSPSQIKLYMKQLLEGTEYMHHNNILHRDMKAANLLISNNGSLKIADFGLARAFDPSITSQGGRDRRYTNCVVTRWYRPPELLLGARQYGGEIDIWGIGCVLGEMFMRRPILPGNSDLDQLDKIWSICGSPNQQNWPDYDKLPGCGGQIRFRPQERRIKQVYESLGKETCVLLDRLLTLDPRERISASEALDHEYFWSDPLPADPKSLPTYEASHEFDQRGRRHQPMMQSEAANPPIRQGIPPPLHKRNIRNEDTQNQAFRTGGPPPHVPQQSFNDPLNGIPPHPLLPPQHHLPPPPSRDSWVSGPARNVGPWGPIRSAFQGSNFRPGYTGLPVGGGPEKHHPSQLPPRPAGLPPRPEGLPQPLGRREASFQNPNFSKQGGPLVRGGPGSGGLNYG